MGARLVDSVHAETIKLGTLGIQSNQRKHILNDKFVARNTATKNKK